MTTFLDTENRLQQLDRELSDLTREHGHILDLDAFRRDLDTAHLHQSRQPSDPAETPCASRRESQLRHELSFAFTDLGGAAFALAHHGALNDKRLAAHVHHIRELYTQLDLLAHTTRVTPPAHAAVGHAAA